MSHTNLDLNWIFGTAADDDLTGTLGSNTTDIFVGFGGDDKFVGYGGNDYVYGGRGDDHLLGAEVMISSQVALVMIFCLAV